MIRSVNELQGMAMKAARGAGVPLGHCEEFAAAVAFVAAADLGQAAATLHAPHHPVDCVWDGLNLLVSEAKMIMAGPVMCDAFRGGANEVRLAGVDSPALLRAYVSLVEASSVVHAQGDIVVVTRSDDVPAAPHIGPKDIADDVWEAFDRFARKTYVPETEASRLGGAGAGLTDND